MFDLPTDDTIGQYHSGGTYNGSSYNSGVYFGGGGGNGCYSEDGGNGGLGGGGNGGPHTGFGMVCLVSHQLVLEEEEEEMAVVWEEMEGLVL
jgi:hypothetical protein